MSEPINVAAVERLIDAYCAVWKRTRCRPTAADTRRDLGGERDLHRPARSSDRVQGIGRPHRQRSSWSSRRPNRQDQRRGLPPWVGAFRLASGAGGRNPAS